jgi:hypothetical protein|nr:hypothetical protein [Kofleriaceae bacterium]
MPISSRTATRLSWIAALAMIACSTQPPLPDADHRFDGSAVCGPDTCGSDQLCFVQYAGIPDAAAIDYECRAIPAGCAVADCFGTQCPSCIGQFCEVPDAVMVSDRTVTCQGI